MMKRTLIFPAAAVCAAVAVTSCGNNNFTAGTIEIAEKIALADGRADSLDFKISAEFPRTGLGKEAGMKISSAITEALFGEEYMSMDPEAAAEAYKAGLENDYRETNLPMLEVEGLQDSFMGWTDYTEGKFTASRKDILSYTAVKYTYTGGAHGMTSDWSKIAVIDTENGSADLYAHLGSYNVLALSEPYNPEKYIEAIGICESAGMEVIIIDSISHCWDYLLDFHANLQGNSFANWAKVTPRQNAFIQRILNSSCHVICTMRSKQEYVLNERNGKMIPEKVGLKAVQRDNVDYEFTIVFDVNMKHYAIASKDRTELFSGRSEFPLTEQVGMQILDWCNQCQTQSHVNYGISYPIGRTAQ